MNIAVKPTRPQSRTVDRDTVIASGRLDIVDVATHFRGPPCRLSRERVLRWGDHGSLVVWLDGRNALKFCDLEANASGDTFKLIQSETGMGFLDAVDWYAEHFLGEHPDNLRPARRYTEKEPRTRTEADDIERNARIERARDIWRTSTPIAGTPAASYLANQLGADLPANILAHPDLRFHPSPCHGGESMFLGEAAGALVALMRDPTTGKSTGVHRTFLTIGHHALEKRTLGRRGVVMLSPDPEVTNSLAICEGIEAGIAIMRRLGIAPIWCALSPGAVGTFPILPGVEALTIFAEHDPPSLSLNGSQAGNMAAIQCAERWQGTANREVTLITPKTPGKRFLDEVTP